MKIAQVAPLMESVPPQMYGGTERVVHFLTEELVAMGHQVDLFASGESETTARLHGIVPQGLRLTKSIDRLAPHVLMLEHVLKLARGYDIIHFHIDHIHLPSIRRLNIAHLSTMHGRLDLPDIFPLYQEFSEIPFSSISISQRKPMPWMNWQGNVYHGLPANLFEFQETPGKYLAFLGRISPEKGIEQAIEIAKATGTPLKIAAKIGVANRKYYEKKVKHLMEDPLIEYIGEINEREKGRFLADALALLFPIEWPEPFGLVMIEAMACGTPVIAFRRGSVEEILEEGTTGYIVENLEQAIESVGKIHKINRNGCRAAFEAGFLSSRMANDYVNIYERLITHARKTKS